MCVTLKVEDGETHWVRLNNRQQDGLLAASADIEIIDMYCFFFCFFFFQNK